MGSVQRFVRKSPLPTFVQDLARRFGVVEQQADFCTDGTNPLARPQLLAMLGLDAEDGGEPTTARQLIAKALIAPLPNVAHPDRARVRAILKLGPSILQDFYSFACEVERFRVRMLVDDSIDQDMRDLYGHVRINAERVEKLLHPVSSLTFLEERAFMAHDLKCEDLAAKLTAQQKDIVAHAAQEAAPGAIISVQAGAGTGKTTTVLSLFKEMLRRDPNRVIHYFVFNKGMQLEMVDRMKAEGIKRGDEGSKKSGVVCVTINAMALRGLKRYFQQYEETNAVARGIMYFLRDHGDFGELKSADAMKWLKEDAKLITTTEYVSRTGKLIIKVLQQFWQSCDSEIGFKHYAAAKIEFILQMMAEKRSKQTNPTGLMPPTDSKWWIERATAIWRAMRQGEVPFTHDAYLALYGLTPGAWDYGHGDVFAIDESQDLNSRNAALFVEMNKKLKVTTISVGDDNQKICKGLTRCRSPGDSPSLALLALALAPLP